MRRGRKESMGFIERYDCGVRWILVQISTNSSLTVIPRPTPRAAVRSSLSAISVHRQASSEREPIYQLDTERTGVRRLLRAGLEFPQHIDDYPTPVEFRHV